VIIKHIKKRHAKTMRAIMLGTLIISSQTTFAQDQAQIEADSLVFDKKENAVSAKGNVNIIYQGKTLSADDVLWNQTDDIIKANGKINLVDPNGTRTKATRMELRDKMQNGEMEDIVVHLSNNAHLKAPRALLIEGSQLAMSEPIYSACAPCANPNDAPLWQISSKEAMQDNLAQTVSYKHNTLDIYGIPIAYIPYFSHPTADVKKRSGFLSPSIGNDGTLGTHLTAPYFINLAPNYDLTLRPQMTTDEGLVLSADWRHLTRAGQYDITLIGNQPQDELATIDGDNAFRGAIITKGALKIEDWAIDFDIMAPTDDTFFERYNISDDTTVTSEIKLERHFANDNISIEMLNYRYVTGGNSATSIQHVLPSLKHIRQFNDTVLGGELTLTNSAIHSVRNYGYDLTELRSRLDWNATHIDQNGFVWRIDNRLQWDGFYYTQGKHQSLQTNAADDETYLANSTSLNVEYPLIRFGPTATQKLKPRLQIIGAISDNDYVSQYLRAGTSHDLSQTDLFRMDSPGIETSRVNYGVEYSIETNAELRAEFFIGQSYNLDNFALASKTGYGDDESNLITDAGIDYANFSINTEFRLDQVDQSVLRNQTSVHYKGERFSTEARYSFYERGQINDRLEEATYSARYRILESWSLKGARQENLRTGRTINDAFGLVYEDDCTLFEIRYQRNNTQIGNVEPSSSINLYFTLRTLGDFNQ